MHYPTLTIYWESLQKEYHTSGKPEHTGEEVHRQAFRQQDSVCMKGGEKHYQCEFPHCLQMSDFSLCMLHIVHLQF